MAQKVDYAALKKGGYMRQKQKGYGSLRLAVVGGNLTAENIKTVAEVAEKYGRGYVHMTSRQGIEIPFIKVEELAEVKEALAKGGVGTGVCGPRVRTVTACQGSEVCPSGCIDTYTLAKELDERYFGRELPHKFKFGVTGCQNNCLKAEENDVGIKGGMNIEYKEDDCISCGVCVKACRQDALKMVDGKIELDAQKCNHCGRCVKSCPVDAWKGTPGYIVSFGGTFGNNIYKGEELLPLIPDKETLFRVPYIRDHVDQIITIPDTELVEAFLDVMEKHKMVVENSGLLSVAALRHLSCQGLNVVCVLSGGNMDVITMASLVQHGLIMRGRIFTFSVLLPDRPGALLSIADILARENGNVIKLEHNQFVNINRQSGVELKVTLEAFGHDHKDRILEALSQAGYQAHEVDTTDFYH